MKPLLLSFLAALPQESRAAASRPTAEQAEIFALIDRFDDTDTTKLPAVKVATGEWWRHGSDEPVKSFRYGFLLDDKDGHFSVRFFDGTRGEFRRSPSSTREIDRIGAEEISIPDAVKASVNHIERAKRESFGYYMSPSSPMHPRGQALILARACARRGRWDDVSTLWNAAAPNSEARDELGHGLLNGVYIALADRATPRLELVRRLDVWLNAFPRDYRREWVQPLRDQLAAADAAPAQSRPASRPAGDASKEQEIADLVLQLKDETLPANAFQYISDGYFVASGLTGLPILTLGDATQRLVSLGFDAVPQLLTTVDSAVISRCVWYSFRHGGAFSVHTVGNLADAILEQIAGLRGIDGRAGWEKWWKDVSDKGEEGVLAERVAKGDFVADDLAERFLERFPHRLDAVLTGARKAGRYYRKHFVEVVSRVRDPRVTELLVEELSTGPYNPARVAAAKALLARGDTRGLDLFREAWSKGQLPKETRRPDLPGDEDSDAAFLLGDANRTTAELLLTSGSLDALRTLREGIVQKSASMREGVVDCLQYLTLAEILAPAPPNATAGISSCFEDLMVALLGDTTRVPGSREFAFGEKYVRIENPRHADLMACALVKHWPDRYRFDPLQPEAARDQKIAEILTAWKAARPASRPSEAERK